MKSLGGHFFAPGQQAPADIDKWTFSFGTVINNSLSTHHKNDTDNDFQNDKNDTVR